MSAENMSHGIMSDAKYRVLMREYDRTNPHDLPELRRRQREHFMRRMSLPEKVYSTPRPVA